jgi:outer membrane protein OmpA-like peptidoglycan-associated protein
MAVDWAADVKKYAASADDAVIAGIVRYCGIALRNRDSSLVSFSDSKETDRVRNNFLKKKLGLTDADSVLDAAIAAVGEQMKADRTKNRVTVYYLLADNFGKLGLFAAKAKATTAKAPAAKAVASKTKAPAKMASLAAVGTAAAVKPAAKKMVERPKAEAKPKAAAKPKSVAKPKAASAAKAAGVAAGTAALGLASTASAAPAATAPSPAPTPSPAPAPSTSAAATGAVGAVAASGAAIAAASANKVSSAAQPVANAMRDDDGDSGLGWLWWLLLALLALFLIWWFFLRAPDAGAGTEAAATAATATVASAAPTDLTAAPLEGSVAIPAGAGVTSELRDGRPVVKVYFETGKADIVPAFTPATDGLKAWLAANSGSSIQVSGFTDASGNAARNAALSKTRAEAVKGALVAGGIADASIALVKPENAIDTAGGAAGRRVEVAVK